MNGREKQMIFDSKRLTEQLGARINEASKKFRTLAEKLNGGTMTSGSGIQSTCTEILNRLVVNHCANSEDAKINQKGYVWIKNGYSGFGELLELISLEFSLQIELRCTQKAGATLLGAVDCETTVIIREVPPREKQQHLTAFNVDDIQENPLKTLTDIVRDAENQRLPSPASSEPFDVETGECSSKNATQDAQPPSLMGNLIIEETRTSDSEQDFTNAADELFNKDKKKENKRKRKERASPTDDKKESKKKKEQHLTIIEGDEERMFTRFVTENQKCAEFTTYSNMICNNMSVISDNLSIIADALRRATDSTHMTVMHRLNYRGAAHEHCDNRCVQHCPPFYKLTRQNGRPSRGLGKKSK